LRRHAANGIGNRAGNEPQAVVARGAIRAGGKAIFDQGLIKKIAGEIASKRPPRAVGTAQAGRETDHEEMGVKRSENRNRRIVPVWLRRPERIAKDGKSRAEIAVRTGSVERPALLERRVDGCFVHPEGFLRANNFTGDRRSAPDRSCPPAPAAVPAPFAAFRVVLQGRGRFSGPDAQCR